MIKVGIVGGTGYTGVELLRILAVHPEVTVSCITSRSEAGMPVADMYPNLRGHYDLAFSEPDADVLKSCDLVFFATPHGVAMRSRQAPPVRCRAGRCWLRGHPARAARRGAARCQLAATR